MRWERWVGRMPIRSPNFLERDVGFVNEGRRDRGEKVIRGAYREGKQ